MLARSKQVEITLESDSYSYYTGQDEGCEEAFRHATRIRHISLNLSDSLLGEWLQRVVSNIPMSAPRLETLSIGSHDMPEDFSLPGSALVYAPNLRRLELAYCKPNWRRTGFFKSRT